MLVDDVTNFFTPTTANQKTYGLIRQPIACYEIAKRTYDFVMTYVENRTINAVPRR